MDVSDESDEESWQVPGTPPAEDDEMDLDEEEVASAPGDEDDEMGDDDDEVQVPRRRGVGGGAAKKAKKAVTAAQHKALQDFVKSVASRLAVPAASAGDAAAVSKRPRSVYPPGSVELPVVTPGTAAELAAQGKSLYAVYAKYVLNPLPPRGGRNLGFQFFVDEALKGHGKCSAGCGCLIKGRRFVKGLEFTSNASVLADLLGRIKQHSQRERSPSRRRSLRTLAYLETQSVPCPPSGSAGPGRPLRTLVRSLGRREARLRPPQS